MLLKSQEEVIARLKKVAAEEAASDQAEGRKCGTRWAENHASPSALRRLASWEEGQGILDVINQAKAIKELKSPVDVALEVAFGLAIILTGGDELTPWSEARKFWGNVIGYRDDSTYPIPDTDFAVGFVAGALEVWEAVADKV